MVTTPTRARETWTSQRSSRRVWIDPARVDGAALEAALKKARIEVPPG